MPITNPVRSIVVDMSPAAIDRRLRELEQLWQVWRYLRNFRPVGPGDSRIPEKTVASER